MDARCSPPCVGSRLGSCEREQRGAFLLIPVESVTVFEFGDETLMELNLDFFRDLDYHFVTGSPFGSGEPSFQYL